MAVKISWNINQKPFKMKHLLVILSFLALTIGGGRNLNAETTNIFRNDTVCKVVSFFGETVVLDDSAHVMQRIKEIAAKNDMLSVEGYVLTVGDVGFGINVHENFISLVSSVKIDDRKMKKVRKYLDKIYGHMTDAGEDNYYWYASENDRYPGSIRMRCLHSDEGGTVMFFE